MTANDDDYNVDEDDSEKFVFRAVHVCSWRVHKTVKYVHACVFAACVDLCRFM